MTAKILPFSEGRSVQAERPSLGHQRSARLPGPDLETHLFTTNLQVVRLVNFSYDKWPTAVRCGKRTGEYTPIRRTL